MFAAEIRLLDWCDGLSLILVCTYKTCEINVRLPVLFSLAGFPAPRLLDRTDTITFTADLEMEVTVAPGRYDLGL